MKHHSAAAPARINWLHELSGGLITGVVAVVYAISYAALLFSGPLTPWLPWGIGLCLVSAVLGAFWLAWRSELPFAIAGPDGSTLSILAAMAATTAGAAGSGSFKGPLEHVLLLLLVTTVLCALLFLLLGLSRLGAWVRYVPFPVIGGFLASTGWLICAGALKVAADLPWGWDALAQWPHYVGDARLLSTVALALVFLCVFRKDGHPALLPLVLLGACLLFWAALAVAGLPLDAARQHGWLLEGVRHVQWMAPWQVLDTRTATFNWTWLAAQWLDMLAVVFVATITVLLGASGLELMSRREISLDRELGTHGWLNLLAAGCGGCISLVSVSRSAVMLESGARTRAAGMLAAAVCGLAALGAGLLLGGIPRIVPAAFLLYIGLAILREWVLDARLQLGRADWALVLAILGITATVGFTTAVLAGMVASCLVFALNYSRVGVVQHDMDGTALHSSVARPAAQRQLLARHGQNIRVLVLRGMIFFGSAHTLLERVRGFLKTPADGARVLLLDFSHVVSADSSAGMTFVKLSRLARAAGVQLVLCGLNPGVQARLAQLRSAPAVQVHGTLDQALEAAEQTLLDANGQQPQDPQETLGAWMLRELGPTHWAALQPLLQRHALADGQALMHQDEPSDATLYLLESGRLTVSLRGQHSGRRLVSLMGGNIVGEMGLYSSAQRSATVLADGDAVVWALTSPALGQLQHQAPDTAMQLHAFVMRTLADRLRLANGTIAALQRGG